MKKSIAAVLILFFLLFGCGGGGENNHNPTSEDPAILGNWEYFDIKLNQLSFDEDHGFEWISAEKHIIGGWTLYEDYNLTLVVEGIYFNASTDIWLGKIIKGKIILTDDALTFVETNEQFAKVDSFPGDAL